MKATVVPGSGVRTLRSVRSGLPGTFNRIARRAVFGNLERLACGNITLIENDAQYVFGKDGISVTIVVSDPGFYRDLALGGSVGAGESYMSGFWSVDDLTSLVRIIILNRNVLLGLDRGPAVLERPLRALLHLLRRNTVKGSRKNIAAHYDLGNEFYRLWLDRTMTYSCNIFEREDSTIEQAAIAKYEGICRKLNLGPNDRVLEIGTGWGGFALHAAKNYGCKVTTTTISQMQYDYAKDLIEREGLQGRIELLFEDYRNLTGKYDKLVSIEMIEAVGHQFLDSYFRQCSSRLSDHGTMALQAIIIADQLYEAQHRNPDFIKRYIFPGSFIPSISAMMKSVARSTDMRLFDLEDITPHYARTLRTWRERFFANIEDVRALGFPDSFIRMWEYYFCYCEGAFLERYIGDVQMILAKPGWRNSKVSSTHGYERLM